MMRSLTAISILLICISAQNPLDAQSYHTKSGKALKAYNEGLNAYDFIDFQKAELEFREAISTDEGFYEAYMMLGELMSKQRRYSEASGFYRKAVRIDSLFFKPVFFSLGMAEMQTPWFISMLTWHSPGCRKRIRLLRGRM